MKGIKIFLMTLTVILFGCGSDDGGTGGSSSSSISGEAMVIEVGKIEGEYAMMPARQRNFPLDILINQAIAGVVGTEIVSLAQDTPSEAKINSGDYYEITGGGCNAEYDKVKTYESSYGADYNSSQYQLTATPLEYPTAIILPVDATDNGLRVICGGSNIALKGADTVYSGANSCDLKLHGEVISGISTFNIGATLPGKDTLFQNYLIKNTEKLYKGEKYHLIVSGRRKTQYNNCSNGNAMSGNWSFSLKTCNPSCDADGNCTSNCTAGCNGVTIEDSNDKGEVILDIASDSTASECVLSYDGSDYDGAINGYNRFDVISKDGNEPKLVKVYFDNVEIKDNEATEITIGVKNSYKSFFVSNSQVYKYCWRASTGTLSSDWLTTATFNWQVATGSESILVMVMGKGSNGGLIQKKIVMMPDGE